MINGYIKNTSPKIRKATLTALCMAVAVKVLPPISNELSKGLPRMIISGIIGAVAYPVLNIFSQALFRKILKNHSPIMIKGAAIMGADVNATDDNGKTALHWADSPECIKLLLDAGADVNATDMLGKTALHWANSPEHIKLLLNAGADVNATDMYRGTALYWVYSPESIQLLLKAGADPLMLRDHYHDENTLITETKTTVTTHINTLQKNTSTPNEKRDAAIKLSAPDSNCCPSHQKELFADQDGNPRSLIEYLAQETPDLLKFALGYHGDTAFGMHHDQVIEVLLPTPIDKAFSYLTTNPHIPNFKDLSNAMDDAHLAYQNIVKHNPDIIAGQELRKEHDAAAAAATKIQAHARGMFARLHTT